MYRAKVLFIAVCVFLSGSAQFIFAQQISVPQGVFSDPKDSLRQGLYGRTDSTVTSADRKQQKDIGDVWRSVTKKNTTVSTDSLQKKSYGKALIPILYPGYALVTGFQICLTTNFSFYADHSKDAKISSVLMNNLYTQYDQIINLINSNIWTKNGKFNFIGDYRLYKFPTNTFGLGSRASSAEKQHVDYSYLKIYEVAMRKISGDFSAGMGYDFDYHWNISADKNPSGDSTDMEKYGYTKTSSSSGITLNFQYDSRLNANNPINSTYAFLELRNNLKALGSNSNWQSLLLDVRKYIQTSKKSGNVLALWSYNWITVKGDIPYFDLPSLGWDHYSNMGRGYVQGRFRGWNMIYAEAEYRFRLTKNGLFGGVLFSNASTLTEYLNNKFEKINPGAGFGLRIKFNKISNTNFAVDYGFGVNGSRGFSFNLNEVF